MRLSRDVPTLTAKPPGVEHHLKRSINAKQIITCNAVVANVARQAGTERWPSAKTRNRSAIGDVWRTAAEDSSHLHSKTGRVKLRS